MTREKYINELEAICKQVDMVGSVFAAIDLLDMTDIESDRKRKTAKLIANLSDRLYEDIGVSLKVAVDKARTGQGEQGGLFNDEFTNGDAA